MLKLQTDIATAVAGALKVTPLGDVCRGGRLRAAPGIPDRMCELPLNGRVSRKSRY